MDRYGHTIDYKKPIVNHSEGAVIDIPFDLINFKSLNEGVSGVIDEYPLELRTARLYEDVKEITIDLSSYTNDEMFTTMYLHDSDLEFTFDGTEWFNLSKIDEVIQTLSGYCGVGRALIIKHKSDSNFNIIIYDSYVLSRYTFLGMSVEGVRQPNVTVSADGESIIPISVTYSDIRKSFVGDYAGRYIVVKIDEAELEHPRKIPEEIHIMSAFINIIEEHPQYQWGDYDNRCTKDLGYYEVDNEDFKYDDEKREIEWVAYSKENASAIRIDADLPLPMTGNELIAYICEMVGFNTFIPSTVADVPFAETVFESYNFSPEEYVTYSQLIRDYARINMVSAYVDEDNNLYFKDNLLNTPQQLISEWDYDKSFGVNEYQVINIITYDHDDWEDPLYVRNEESIAKYGEHEYRFTDSRLLDVLTREDIQVMLETLGAKLFNAFPDGYKYLPFESQALAVIPGLLAGDVVDVRLRDGGLYRAHLTDNLWSTLPALEGDIKGQQLPETLTDFTLSDEMSRFLNMGVRVDRINRDINLFINSFSEDLTDLITRIGLTENAIEMEVAERKEQGDRILEETKANMELLKDSFTLEFSRIDGSVDELTGDLNEWKTTYQLTADGATIGKSDSELQITISNDQISFLDGGSVTAYVNGQVMYIKSLEILESIILGYHQILKYDGVQKGTIWKPISGGNI